MNSISVDLLSEAIGRILSNKYGKTVTVRITDVSGKIEKDELAGCPKAD